MKIKQLILSAVISSAVLFSAAAQTTLKIATIAPSRSVWDIESKRISQEWAQITSGKVKMQFMNATAMGGETGVVTKLNAVRPGQKAPIDGAVFTNIGIGAVAPDTKIFTLCAPFLFRNQEEVDLIYETFKPQLSAALSEKGYVLMGKFMVGWAYFYTKKPVHTIEELKSQKLSVGGMGLSDLSDAFKMAGYKCEDVPANKMLQSMKTPGGLEGFYTIPMYGYAGQYYKELPYILNIPLCPIICTFILNEKIWNSFSEEEKTAMMESIKKCEKNFVEEQKNADKEYLELSEKGGCTLVNLSDSELKAFEDALRQDTISMTKSGIIDEKFYKDILAVLKEYRGE